MFQRVYTTAAVKKGHWTEGPRVSAKDSRAAGGISNRVSCRRSGTRATGTSASSSGAVAKSRGWVLPRTLEAGIVVGGMDSTGNERLTL